MSRRRYWLEPILAVAALLGLWEAACRFLHLPTYLLPPPSAIGHEVVVGFPVLMRSAGVTLARALIALLLSGLVSSALALAVAASPRLEAMVRPLATTVQVTPIVAIAPLIVIWAGLAHAERAVIALAAAVAFYPIYSGMLTGLKSFDRDLERLFDLYGARRWQKLLRLQLPSALPYLIEGVRVGAGLSVIGAVMAEFVAGSGQSEGLAWRLLEASYRLQTAKVFAALAVMAIMGGLLHACMLFSEQKILAWWRGR